MGQHGVNGEEFWQCRVRRGQGISVMGKWGREGNKAQRDKRVVAVLSFSKS